MTAKDEIGRIARRARVRYKASRREVIVSLLFIMAISLSAVSYAVITGMSILATCMVALTWFVIGTVTIGMLMVTDEPGRKRPRR